MKKLTLVILALVTVIGTITVAFARENTGAIDRSIGSIRMQMRENRIRIEGLLTCDTGTENNGQACELKIQDQRTGKIYQLTENANQAMRLYQAGTKNVAIVGEMRGNRTVAVLKTEVLN